MPVLKTVSVTYGRKFNLGDFNSLELACTLWADVDPDEDLDQAMHSLWEMARTNVRAAAEPVISRGAATRREVFLGLPREAQQTITE